jgi:anti-sigma factor RsiW
MSARSDACYPWLTDFLCDYVDGTMEPQARELFEECLGANPELAAHVAQLKGARRTLCRYGAGLSAPSDLHDALHARLRSDCRCAQAYAACCATTDSSSRTVGVSALVAVLMVSALLVLGSTLEPDQPEPRAALVDRPPAPSRHAAPLVDASGARLLPASAPVDTMPRFARPH